MCLQKRRNDDDTVVKIFILMSHHYSLNLRKTDLNHKKINNLIALKMTLKLVLN